MRLLLFLSLLSLSPALPLRAPASPLPKPLSARGGAAQAQSEEAASYEAYSEEAYSEESEESVAPRPSKPKKSKSEKSKPLLSSAPSLLKSLPAFPPLLLLLKAFVASLLDPSYLPESPRSVQGSNLRSALERKSFSGAASGARKGARKMGRGKAKTLADLPKLSA
ncbi:hypothetical protein TeGR_g12278 [Tetraparma gracilis]|uniref:Uncharacterized protein n=1 Tax=Tetraparma gracilis TaxID=2962635 RepID=A0ABQ6MXB2_9STRA|nr:hypothetical protein TeGR_g12278 [Tetraparma gracilis]